MSTMIEAPVEDVLGDGGFASLRGNELPSR